MTHKPNSKIIVVGMDEYSMGKLGIFPWDRKVYIPFLENLKNAGAKVIAFDVLFNSKSSDEKTDLLFADELQKFDNVILPSYGELPSTPTNIKNMVVAKSISQPLQIFKTNKAHINTYFDSDGIIRKVWLEIGSSEGSIYQFAYKASELAGAKVNQYLNYHPQKQIYIKYNAQQEDFTTIPFAKVVENDFPKDAFKDKIVLIGFTSPGYDEDSTPIKRNMKLIYVHANLLSQLLNNEVIYKVNELIIILIVLLIIGIGILITWQLNSRFSFISIMLIAFFLTILQYLLFSYKGIFLNVVYILVALLFTYLMNISLKSYFNIKEKDFITRQFGRYISPDIVEQISREQIDIKLGGITKEITIMFLDIRGFTTMSEKLKPNEVVDVLNLMFNMITEIVLSNNGTIDKFIGDAAMVLFNAPLDLSEHEYLAVKTALEIQAAMEKIKETVFAKYGEELGIGIGINTGFVVIGNIGSFLRLDYTAIGDAVNTASRIEANSKAKDVLVSESTYERTKDRILYEYFDELLMKGKTIPIRIFRAKGLL